MKDFILAPDEWQKLTPQEQFDFAYYAFGMLTAADDILNLIPPCPVHGKDCREHQEQWIREKMGKK